MEIFKIRASAIGQIMTNARSKSETLSETAKTYLKQWYIENKFGRKKEIDSKFLKKGLEVEEKSITLLNEYLVKSGRNVLLKKNPESFESDFITGTPDLIFQDEIWDIKSSWDLFTFPMFDTECANKMYYWQLQGYMALTGLKKSFLCYVLMNTPEQIQFDEARALSYKMGLGGDITDEIDVVIRKNHTFDDIPLNDRIRIFEVERDEEAIESVYEKVAECRKFLNTI